MAKIVTMGEIMLRLSTPNNEKFIQADEFDVCYGGGEANVAVSLANFGHNASFVTKVPDNPIGESALAALRKYNVDTDFSAKGGARLGIYFLESGSAVRPSNVVYDRANSSISTAEISDFDFDSIFKDADLFHFSGITPAISDSAAKLTDAALKAAKKHGVKVSVDFNYRAKLWSAEKSQQVMTALMPYADIFFGGPDDARKILGFDLNSDYENSTEEHQKLFRQISEKFNFEYVVSTVRVSRSASDNDWSAYIYSAADDEFYYSKQYRLHPIVDRVGGGDSFAAGTLCGLLDGKDYKSALEFGVAASALKHSIPGDFNLASRSEVETLANGNGDGKIQR